MTTITVIGLGYVGLPLACLCARKGYAVYGVEKNKQIIEKTNKGISHIKDDFLTKELKELKGKIIATEPTEEAVKDSDIIIICVPTPVDKNHKPILDYVISASEYISLYLKEGQLIVVESTIHPGTCEEIVKPILDKSNKKYCLVHCPERIDPGNNKYSLKNIPRVLGGMTKECAEKARLFYESIIDAPIMVLNSIKAAEATKVVENSFRDINIAFVNELAKSFDKAGIDILEVIKGASTKPFSFMPHYPGIGVGGHCIPVDPYYLIEKAKNLGFEHKFLSLARNINNSMPEYAVSLLKERIKEIKGAKVGILGIAYKADIDDARESPYFEIRDILKDEGAEVIAFDPYIKDRSDTSSAEKLIEKVDYIILCTSHSEFLNLDFKNIKVIIDGRNCLDKENIEKKGIIYKGIGR